MSEQTVTVVQVEWKRGGSRHDRNFMLTFGSLFDLHAGQDHRSVPLGFWGEWEDREQILPGAEGDSFPSCHVYSIQPLTREGVS
jgi:hypothetical protein